MKKKNRGEGKFPPFMAILVGNVSLGGRVLRASPALPDSSRQENFIEYSRDRAEASWQASP